MKPLIAPLEPGLYLVATPIGNARDITLRALDVLASADVIAAEDTRTTRKLLEIHGVSLGDRKVIAYHDHSGAAGRAGILKLIAQGNSVAYASEAGSPLIADPGFALARDVAQDGHHVTALPGPTAAITAISLSGLPSDRFCFAGFAPSAKGARQKWLAELLAIPATLIIYESPKRVNRLLEELCSTEASARPAALCRELTKRFEEIRRGTVQDILDHIPDMTLKGEIALVIGQAEAGEDEVDLEQVLANALQEMSMKDAVAMVTQATGLPRRKVYQTALGMGRDE